MAHHPALPHLHEAVSIIAHSPLAADAGQHRVQESILRAIMAARYVAICLDVPHHALPANAPGLFVKQALWNELLDHRSNPLECYITVRQNGSADYTCGAHPDEVKLTPCLACPFVAAELGDAPQPEFFAPDRLQPKLPSHEDLEPNAAFTRFVQALNSAVAGIAHSEDLSNPRRTRALVACAEAACQAYRAFHEASGGGNEQSVHLLDDIHSRVEYHTGGARRWTPSQPLQRWQLVPTPR